MDGLVLDLLIRGAILGLLGLYILILAWAGKGFDAARRGALLAFGIACYTLNASQSLQTVLPDVWRFGILIPFSVINPVFLWWFTGALFKDRFPVLGWRLIPAAVLLGNYVLWELIIGVESFAQLLVHTAGSIAVFALVIWLPLQDRASDLIERRRAIRAAFAIAAGVLGVVIISFEFVNARTGLPTLALTGTTLLFGAAFLGLRRDLLAPRAVLPEKEARRRMGPEDAHFLDKLKALMDQGIYREEGLTVAKLAERVGVPEHRLRKIINQGLGYRNFSAFLNERRVAEAKIWLEDPEHGLTPVSGLAYDLGYASLGPFNRAFKEVTGQTPTEYRRAVLADSGKD
ncbi:helix-turn-helix domain-containing protein [Hyphobacterium sp.]|uniref:helix-turn-helix domain-containing protein n=1 Tax=Hyphobacterium sp. TaxID=2004662 RepID=UPI00374887C2